MSLIGALRLSRQTAPAFVAEGVFWGAFAAYVPDLKAAIGASDAQYGMILLGAALGAVTAMWLAPIIDAWAGRFAMALGAVLLALCFQLPIHAGGLLLFGVGMVLAGGAAGLLDVVMNARLSLIESRNKTSLMNLNHAIFSFAYAASAVAAGLAREAGTSPVTIFAILLVLVWGSAPLMLQGNGDGHSQEHINGAKPRLGRIVWLGGLITFAGFLAENAAESWSALHIERTLGGGAAEGALGPAMLGLTMGVGRLAGQLVVARLSAPAVLFWAAVLSASGALVAAAAPSPVMAYFGFGMLGLGVSVVAPMAFALVGQRVDDDQRARAISRVAIIGYFGFFVGPPVLGFVAQAAGLRFSFVVVALVLAAIPGLLAMIRRGAD